MSFFVRTSVFYNKCFSFFLHFFKRNFLVTNSKFHTNMTSIVLCQSGLFSAALILAKVRGVCMDTFLALTSVVGQEFGKCFVIDFNIWNNKCFYIRLVFRAECLSIQFKWSDIYREHHLFATCSCRLFQFYTGKIRKYTWLRLKGKVIRLPCTWSNDCWHIYFVITVALRATTESFFCKSTPDCFAHIILEIWAEFQWQ